MMYRAETTVDSSRLARLEKDRSEDPEVAKAAFNLTCQQPKYHTSTLITKDCR